MKFYYENLIDATVTYSGTAEVDNPATNLNDPKRFNLFLDNSPASGVFIKIDFGSGKQCDSIALGNFYTTGATTCNIYGSNNDSSYSLISSFSSPTTADNHIEEFTQATWRYWKIVFSTSGSFTKLQIGNIFLGNKFETNHDPELSINRTSNYSGIINQTITGKKDSLITQNEVRKQFILDYQYINPTDKVNFEKMRDVILMNEGDSLYPLFFNFCDDDYFVRWQGGLNLTDQAYQAYQTTINLIGEL